MIISYNIHLDLSSTKLPKVVRGVTRVPVLMCQPKKKSKKKSVSSFLKCGQEKKSDSKRLGAPERPHVSFFIITMHFYA